MMTSQLPFKLGSPKKRHPDARKTIEIVKSTIRKRLAILYPLRVKSIMPFGKSVTESPQKREFIPIIQGLDAFEQRLSTVSE
jgi:hypothetical protein